ncbi:hypothetical protein F2Q68_00003610 [Brassica cretica]|uniref:Uncharacterized protein n=1 Tax=Brassica cretica TaxID=69181 RepID=A0A8S9J377_BRACR|nr:hypothetical protein F2Q68_00003610 [Brassica cretica]
MLCFMELAPSRFGGLGAVFFLFDEEQACAVAFLAIASGVADRGGEIALFFGGGLAGLPSEDRVSPVSSSRSEVSKSGALMHFRVGSAGWWAIDFPFSTAV